MPRAGELDQIEAIKAIMRLLDRLPTSNDRREVLRKVGNLYDLVVSERGGQP